MYSNQYDSNKTHYIMISKNIKNNQNNGIKINIKGYIPSELNNNNYTTLDNYDTEKLKNRVIFSANINNNTIRPLILLTQQNINHNIKLVYKNIKNTNINDLTNPRIIFIKYFIHQNHVKYDNKKLFSTNSDTDTATFLNSIYYQNKLINIDNEDSYINSSNVDSENYRTKKLIIGYNVYNPYRNSNFYKINFRNFINEQYITNRNYNNTDPIEATVTRLSNLNNYNQFNNHQLLYENQSNNMTNSSNNRALYDNIYHEQLYYFIDNSENQLTLLNKNFYFQEKDFNFLIYNKEKNLKDIKIKFRYFNNYIKNYEFINNYNDIEIYFFIRKYKYFTNDFYNKKIILNKNFTYLSTKIIDSNSNFYYNNNINYKNKVHLSFGYNIFGLTKYNLFNNFKFTNNKIFITNKTKLVVTGETYDYLNNADYLLHTDDNYNYDYYHTYINDQFILNNKELKYNTQKIFNNILNFNNYINVYNNYYIINNDNTKLLIYRNNFNHGYSITNSLLYTKTEDDIMYDKELFSFKLIDDLKAVKPGANFITLDNNTNNYIAYFNFKNNYDVTFYSYFKLNLKDIHSNIILNENKINLSIKIQALPGDDFKNVNCVFIYHNPSTTTDPSFLYPNDNVEVITNPSIDTISKAIELLPISSRLNKNTTIIPDRNASNLSKKQIQGLIGLNNIPRLLTIKPYDESFIIGRGFINQYRIENDCPNYTDKVKLKLNSQKHSSVKSINRLSNNIKVKNNNFSSLVNNRVLNKNIKGTCTNPHNNPKNITNYYTPMKMFKTKGIFLPSGK